MTSLRPRWKKKRWAAALALWLLFVYPLSVDVACRGWVPRDAGMAFYHRTGMDPASVHW